MKIPTFEAKVNDIANDVTAKAEDFNKYKCLFIEIHHLLNKLFIDKGNKKKTENKQLLDALNQSIGKLS